MATHGFQEGAKSGVTLPDAVPFELPRCTRLSWELGAQIVDDTARHSEWERTGGSWVVSIFRPTDNTVVVRVRTPVGRERFYNLAELDLEAVCPALEAAPHWQRLE